jgi:hypothetical protein
MVRTRTGMVAPGVEKSDDLGLDANCGGGPGYREPGPPWRLRP